jgi:hypothetical protein
VGGVGAAWANPWTGNYGRAARGSYYNTATGGRGAGYVARNTNIYTGTTSVAAGGIRYNPQTGRVVAGQGGAAYNAYTGNAAAGGARVTANTNTGRVTASKGGAVRTDAGTTVGGGFKSAGAGGDISGAGFAHKDSGTGQVTTGGVIKAGDNVYAGKDGNVYKYTPGEGWKPVDRPSPTERGNAGGNVADRAGNSDFGGIDADRAARDRGYQRDSQRAARSDYGSASFDRGNYNRSYNGNMGGARYGGSTGSFRGGGMRGGGMRGGGRR